MMIADTSQQPRSAATSSFIPGRGLLLQRKCACGGSTGASGECEACGSKKRLQAKLAVGASNDPLEQEADRVADQVLAAPAHAAISGAAPRIQRFAGQPAGEAGIAPASVDHALADSGRSLEPALRQDMERRFGHDFSQVRVHSNAVAEHSALEVNANAYAVGHHIVFGAGRFAPGTHDGRRLIAHELTHVVQQHRGEAVVQRDDKKAEAAKPAGKTDVAIVLTDDEQDMAEGRAYAATVLRVTDAADAAAKLKALGVPVGRLYVVSHSNNVGEVQFISSIGTISWVPIRDLGNALKGQVTIDDIDFRGCKIGSAAGALESVREKVGAKSAQGSNCWTFTQRAPPLSFEGADITSPSQIPKDKQAQFDTALLKQLAGMTADNGTPVSQCLVGLGQGERPGKKTLAKIWPLYWANNGNLIATWASPEFNKNWQRGSICTKDMTETSKPCGIVQTKAPAATPPAAGGKASALETPGQGTVVGSATSAEDGPWPEQEMA